jgi:hypothetical protein
MQTPETGCGNAGVNFTGPVGTPGGALCYGVKPAKGSNSNIIDWFPGTYSEFYH